MQWNLSELTFITPQIHLILEAVLCDNHLLETQISLYCLTPLSLNWIVQPIKIKDTLTEIVWAVTSLGKICLTKKQVPKYFILVVEWGIVARFCFEY